MSKETQRNKKAVLMVAYWFPPLKTASLRSYFVYQEFKKYFTSVSVLTTKNQKKLPNEVLPLDENDQHLLTTFDYRTLLQSSKKNQKPTFSDAQKKGKFQSFFVRLLDSFPFNLWLGEGGILYIFHGFWKGRQLIKKQKITHIYSSFRPYSDHFIAFLLKICFPEIIWISDFRDLHFGQNSYPLFGLKFQKWCNKKIIQKADVVTTVSKGLQSQLKIFHDDVYLLRNGFNQQILDRVPPIVSSKKFQIGYTGSVDSEKQTPKLLLRCLASLIEREVVSKEKINLVYAGKDGEIWQKWIKENGLLNIFANRNLVSRTEAIAIQTQSHINLLLSYSSPTLKGILTGKMYEYFAVGKPILALINGEKDEEFEEIFADLDTGLVVYNKETEMEKLKEFILKKYQEWKETGCVRSAMNQKQLADYQWENRIPKFLKYLAEQQLT